MRNQSYINQNGKLLVTTVSE